MIALILWREIVKVGKELEGLAISRRQPGGKRIHNGQIW